MQASAASQRTLLWITLFLAGLFVIGYFFLSGMFPPPPPTLDATQVAQLYSTHNLRLRVAVVLCICGSGYNATLALTIAIQMARMEKGLPVWAILELIAGTLACLWYALPPLWWGVAAFSPERDPALTLLMHEQSWLGFVTPVGFWPLQAAPLAIVALSRTGAAFPAFPRWFGYATIMMLISGEMGVVAQLFKSGPFAWNGIFPFYLPFVLFGLWITAICVLTFRAIRLQESVM